MRRFKTNDLAITLLNPGPAIPRPILVRPAAWEGSGEALVAHGGQLYRSELGLPTTAYPVTLSDLAHRWQMLSIDELRAEKDGSMKAPRVRADRSRTLGRPSGANVAADFPGWVSVADGALSLGIHPDRLRRSVRAGLIPSRKERGVLLVPQAHLRELLPLGRAKQATSPVVVTEEEVYS